MKRIDLVKIKHDFKIGQRCENIKPNITEDVIFYEDGIPIGFYLSKMPDKMCNIAEIANIEFSSDNVPKTLLERTDVIAKMYKEGISRKEARKTTTIQMSTILGGVPPKPQFKRSYPTQSSTHSHPKAKKFIKAMLLLAKESEQLIKTILPEQYEKQKQLFENVSDNWKFGSLFTSSISNYNISAPYHRDAGNIEGTVNVIITKRKNSVGGCLNVPDYNATIEQKDNSILVYPAWKNVHGVTPIIPTHEGGYRNSLVFYPLKAFKGLE